MPRNFHTKGFTLIEVLVTLLVLAVGLLGLAALQATGLRYNQSAYLRSQASIYAYSIIDSMRANRDSAESAGYNTDFGSTIAPVDCVNNVCSEGQMAGYDLGQWKDLLSENLPNGDGKITVASSVGGTIVTISIRWSDSRESPTAYTIFNYETEL